MSDDTAQPPKRILFVCVENSNRSQMAEAFARLHGAGRVEAYSAGSRPSGKVNPRAVEYLRGLAGLQAAEMPFSTRVAREFLSHRSSSAANVSDREKGREKTAM